MTLKVTISDSDLSLASTAISDDVHISNDFIFDKIMCERGEVVIFHDCIAPILKGKFLAKVFYGHETPMDYRWFYSLEDALATHDLGAPDSVRSMNWRKDARRAYECLNGSSSFRSQD